MDNVLSMDTITFGKYKDLSLDDVLKDRNYCKWLVTQDWFEQQYEYLYNRVLGHCPLENFVRIEHLEIDDNMDLTVEEFLLSYEYFHLTPLEDLKLELTKEEKIVYSYYLSMIDLLKNRILERIQNGEVNPYDIKAPRGWLKTLEKKHGVSRVKFKEFLSMYELRNLPYVVEDIKKMGGIEYKGAKSYLIAKKRSEIQEAYWEEKLKNKYGESIGTQFKFKNCVFDMINISSRTLYECKLGLKDFNEDQYRKYVAIMGTSYRILYPIGMDCVVDMSSEKIYTTDENKYYGYLLSIPGLKKPSKFDLLIRSYEVVRVDDVIEYI